MIEQGLYNLITAGLNDSTIQGGFPVQLPKDCINKTNRKAWTYRSILSTPIYTLNGEDTLTDWEVQIDCHGFTMADAMNLARSIKSILGGAWSGIMTDTDYTVCVGIFQAPGQVDGFQDSSRTFVRSLEYNIHYYDVPITAGGSYTYYINPISGSDSNNGTSIATAWLTTAPADVVSLSGSQNIGYLLNGSWYLYRAIDMTAAQDLISAALTTAPATAFGETSFTYYVDPVGGSDSNNGMSAITAWKTTTPADSVSLTGSQNVGYLFGSTWFLYRAINMTDDEAELSALLVTAPATDF